MFCIAYLVGCFYSSVQSYKAKVPRSMFSFSKWGIILWIELPWPENLANTYTRHTETLDSCFNLIRFHQQLSSVKLSNHSKWSNAQHVSAPTTMILPTMALTASIRWYKLFKIAHTQILQNFWFIIGLVGRVFANGPGDRGSVPGRIIPKT